MKNEQDKSSDRRQLAVDEYLDLAAAQKPYFPPGKGFTYSNTDYNLLGLAVERATGRSWRQEIHDRVVEALHLEDTLPCNRMGEVLTELLA